MPSASILLLEGAVHIVFGFVFATALFSILARRTRRAYLLAVFGSTFLCAAFSVLTQLFLYGGTTEVVLLRGLDLLVFFYLPALLVLSGWIRWSSPNPLARAGSWAGLALLGLGVWVHWIEPRWLEVRTLRIESDRLDIPIRIAVLSDLQTDRVGPWETRVLRRLAAVGADLILFPGDFIEAHRPGERRRLETALARLFEEVKLRAPLGVFAVAGDVDPATGWESFLSTSGVEALVRCSSLDLGPIVLTGLPLQETRELGLTFPPTEKLHVIFGHAPDYALGAQGGDILIAGHTHGGQVRIPGLGPILTHSRIPRRWNQGLTELSSNRWLVVSRGIGMRRGLAPRIRFLSRPEILVLDVVPSHRPDL